MMTLPSLHSPIDSVSLGYFPPLSIGQQNKKGENGEWRTQADETTPQVRIRSLPFVGSIYIYSTPQFHSAPRPRGFNQPLVNVHLQHLGRPQCHPLSRSLLDNLG